MFISPRREPNPFLSTSDSPAFQRFQELSRVAGLSRAFTLSVSKRQGSSPAASPSLALPAQTPTNLGIVGRHAGLTSFEIAQQLQLSSQAGFRGVTDWLDVLVSLGTLRRSVHGGTARYSNSTDADTYLSQQSPDYMGGHAVLYHDRTFPQYLFLEQSLKTGVQPEAAHQLVVPVLDTFSGAVDTTTPGSAAESASGGDPTAFALGMTGSNKPAFELLANKFDFSRYKTLADIGGSAGVLCCAVARAQPHMLCTTLDLPAVHSAAEQYVAQQGLQAKVKVADIDFLSDAPFPACDVITMGMILHDWGAQKKKLLIQKAFNALPPGGAFVALDLVIDDSRCSNVWGLLMSLDMLLEFEAEGAADYTFKEFTEWTTAAGFKSTQLIHLIGPNSAAVAFK